MNRDVEPLLRSTLRDAEASAPVPHDLAARLLAGATAQASHRIVPLRGRRSARRWVAPLFAAAAVVAVVLAVTLVRSVHSSPRPAGPPLPTAPYPTHFRATSVSFADRQHGWAVGDGDCARLPGCPALLRTLDGGRHWQAVPLPSGLGSAQSCGLSPGTPGGQACVDQLAFADELHGYLWGVQDVYATRDGGASWRHERRHFVGVTIAGTRAVGAGAQVLTARVGSLTWHVAAGQAPPAAQLTSSGRRTYVVAGSPSGGSVQVVSGIDGRFGAWRQLRPCGSAEVGLVRAAPEGAVAVTCRGSDGPAVAVSTDHAETFGPARAIPGAGNPDAVAFVLPVTKQVLLARVGNRQPGNTYYRSADGGASWHVVGTDTSTQTMFGWQMFNDHDGYRTQPYGAGLLVTHDAGLTWTAQPFAP